MAFYEKQKWKQVTSGYKIKMSGLHHGLLAEKSQEFKSCGRNARRKKTSIGFPLFSLAVEFPLLRSLPGHKGDPNNEASAIFRFGDFAGGYDLQCFWADGQTKRPGDEWQR